MFSILELLGVGLLVWLCVLPMAQEDSGALSAPGP